MTVIGRAVSASDRKRRRELLAMFALGFGIPLSLLALATGISLALTTQWRLFRYPWVVAKLALIVSVILVGAFVISPVLNPRLQANDASLIAGATWDVVALGVAVCLAVFKPGARFRRRARRATP